MYSGSDLDTLMSALATLTNSGFLEYDFNVGQKIPYLSITVSNSQIAAFPALATLPAGQKIINLYYTTDFTPDVDTFISNFQSGIKSAIDNNADLIAEINSQMSNWSTFETTYNSFG